MIKNRLGRNIIKSAVVINNNDEYINNKDK